jgi:hypothetical protein
MSETPWVDNVTGNVFSSEILLPSNTAVNIYGHSIGSELHLEKKGPDDKFYGHKINSSSRIGNNDSSFIIIAPGTYRIVGIVGKPIYITYEIL